MINRTFLVFFLLLVASYLCNLEAAGNRYLFEQISIREGLSQTFVRDVIRDKYGLLWIGTKDGLNRYDGQEVISYFHNPDIKGSLPDNYIHFIIQDDADNIWVGTNKGLAQYQPYNDDFILVNPRNTQNSQIYSNALQIGSSVIFGTSNHLAIYNTHSATFRILNFRGKETSLRLSYKQIPWHNRSVLIASRWGGMFTCDLNTGELTRASFCKETEVVDAFLDSYKNLWVSIYQKGMYKYDWKGNEKKFYNTDNSDLSNNTVLTINEVNGNIWMGTDGGGISILNPSTEEFSTMKNSPEERSSIPTNSITRIYKDDYSDVWIGTIRSGLLGMKQVSISQYGETPLNSNFGLSNQTVLSLFEEEDGKIWIGTDGGGVNIFNPKAESFKHIPKTFGGKVNGLARLSDHTLLMNWFGQGLYVYDQKKDTVEPFSVTGWKRDSLPGSGMSGMSLINLEKSRILFLTDRIYLYDGISNELERLSFEKIDLGEGEIKVGGWMGDQLILYTEKSIFLFNSSSQVLERLAYGSPSIEGKIVAVTVDLDNLIWVGSTSGLYYFDATYTKIHQVSSGLFRSITAILADDKGRIWFGADGSLFTYYKSDGFFKLQGRSDGVLPNEYLAKSVLKSTSGDIYLGGVEGLIRIDKDYSSDREFVGQPKVIGIYENGTLIGKNKYDQFHSTGKIILPHNFNSFNVDFFIKDADFFNKKHIRYKVEGFMSDYIETSKLNIDLSGLSNGKYTLLVSTYSIEGTWSDPIKIMDIRVLPPWWRTWWFIAISIVAIFSLLMLIRYLAYRRAYNNMKLHLADKENSMNLQRIRFLVNISHELRTPLSLVFGPLERILKGYVKSEEEKDDLLRMMFRHVNYIKRLLDQLLDTQRDASTEVQLNLSEVNLSDMMNSILNEFDYLFKEHGIDIKYNPDQRISSVVLDEEKCKKVLYNFLINVMRHAPSSKEIILSTELIKNETLRISVKDQGPGVPPEMIEKVFERFYMGDDSKGGTGIGLAYAKMLMEVHKGQIGVYNHSEGGALFYFDLPINLKVENKVVTKEYEKKPVDAQVSLGEEGDLSINKELAEGVLSELVVLLVEDDLELLNFFKKSLSGLFKKVLTAVNGKEALQIIHNDLPDLIVSDVMMPEMDGWELCRNIKTNIEISHIPVILLTARSNEADSLMGYKLGADNYLTKPVSVDLLISVISNVINNRLLLKKRYLEGRKDLLPSELTYSNADETFLIKINAIIDEEIENPNLNVDLLVDKMGMSRASLYNKMKVLVDTGVNSYINDCRIKHAIRLLETTDLPIADISSRLGFMSQSYFSTLFKQFTNLSPMKYRQEYLKKEENS